MPEIVNVLLPVTVTVWVTLNAAGDTPLIVTVLPVASPWLLVVVTVAVDEAPVRVTEVTGIDVVSPNIDAAMLVFAVEKSLSACLSDLSQLALPLGHHVYRRRGLPVAPLAPVKVDVRFSSRSCCATPPFSTTSPSGESNALRGVPMGAFLKKPPRLSGEVVVFFLVQKLMAVGDRKPVPAELMAGCGFGLALSPITRPPELPRISWYCFRLPSQRGAPEESGRNMPRKIWFR